MVDATSEPTKKLTLEIEKSIRYRTRYEKWDFRLAHILLWASITTSFISSIIIASHWPLDRNNKRVAVMAGIPGLVILVDKTFDFASRAVWGSLYRIELEELKDKIAFKKIESYAASMNFREINKRHEK